MGWGAGILHYSLYAATMMPFDEFFMFVDGQRGDGGSNQINRTSFEHRLVSLLPGTKNVTWVYEYNPFSLPVFPPEPDDRIAAVFLDNVYFDPIIDTTYPPNAAQSTQPTASLIPSISTQPSTYSVRVRWALCPGENQV